MNKLDELYAKALAASIGRKEAAQKNVNEVLSAIFAEMPKLNLIRVQGYTPSFNDGDPCNHSQTVAVDVYDPDCLFESLDEDDELCSLMTGEKLDWSHCAYENGQTSRTPLPQDPHHAACIKAREVVDAMDGDFEILFDTNFTLDIVRDTESEFGFRIDLSDYDCGY
jgi:hypothetical protein